MGHYFIYKPTDLCNCSTLILGNADEMSIKEDVDEEQKKTAAESPIPIPRKIYDALFEEADRQRLQGKRLTAELLKCSLFRSDYLKKFYNEIKYHDIPAETDPPKIKLEEGNNTFYVSVVENKFYCEKDKSFDCKHTTYCYIHPQAIELLSKMISSF